MVKQLALALLLITVLFSCRKEDDIDTNADTKLQFSTDSLLFDTVFTSTGTTNRTLKIFNYNKNSVIISNIQLLGGPSSPFKININGTPASAINNLKIRGNDSIYVFVKAFIDPTSVDQPFLVEDEIQINLNGNQQKIPLAAYGQNAIYLNNETISANTTFTKGKPYIIYNNATVAKNTILTLEAGARLYFHKSASLAIAGTLKAHGTLTDSITFTSDRQERIYNDEPGQWDGVQFLASSINNALNYCTIKNALVGLTVDSLSSNTNPKLLLTNSIIKNHQVAGVLGYNASVTAINNLIYNCGQYLVAGFYGGDFNFYQNTLANYNFNFPRKTPSVYFTDYLNTDLSKIRELKTQFINNIIFGSLTRELGFDKKGSLAFVQDFQNNSIRTDKQELGASNFYNDDPFFINTRKENYQLVSNSPANDKGKDLSAHTYFTTYLNKDILQKARVFPSTLGCYEK
ncbi:hypothetical protein [Pedobacter arcticus]|uniref:hypothetical protein n=1 Tax=Pedobacter arcticus TaxID=752140 RepID=UPI0002D90887|nr:hypothetical protein [Pedobacter arcticus]